VFCSGLLTLILIKEMREMGEMMGNRLAQILTLTILLVSIVVPVTGFALGLGPITMRSALNQPLLAEIDVHSVQPGDLDKLAIRLASEEDFGRVNVERTRFLSEIKFAIAFKKDGSAYVKLTTDQAVTEPYLDFLIEARWPRGRALKEYTVLVDPPVLTAEAPAPVQQAATAPVFRPPPPKATPRPRVSAPTPEREFEPEARRGSSSNRPKTRLRSPDFSRSPTLSAPVRDDEFVSELSEPSSFRQPSGSGSDDALNYGEVQRNDTLWEIALEMQANADSARGVSVYKIMMALLKSNPRAFYQGNINQLKAGAVLRIDDPSVFGDYSVSSAVQEVREQTVAWQDQRSGRLTREVESSDFASAANGDSAGDGSGREGADSRTGAELKLVAPGEEGQGSGSGAEDSSDPKRLGEELLLATETLDANRQESSDLKTRMGDLDEQLTSMQRLIMLKDEELLSLQNRLKDGPDVPAVSKEPILRKRLSAEDEATFGFLSDTMILAIGVFLVIVVVFWLIMRRRRMQDGFEESILNVGMAAGASNFDGGMNQTHSQSAAASDFGVSDMGGVQADAAEVDPISEADVYLAYGRHQQAEDIVRQALNAAPDRAELHVKLMEVHHAANNRSAFEEHAQLFSEKFGGDGANNPYWDQIVALGIELSPGNPLFGGVETPAETFDGGNDATATNVTAEEEDLLDFDFSSDDVMQQADSSLEDSLDLDVSDLDFDLGEDFHEDAIADIDSLDAASDGSIADAGANVGFSEPVAGDTGIFNSIDETDLNLDDEISLDTVDLELGGDEDLASTILSESPDLKLDMEEQSVEEEFNLDFDMESDPLSDPLEETTVPDSSNVVAFDGESLDDDFDDDIFADVDEVGTKLDLAKAYVDMGDSDGARSILDEVMEEGDDTQKEQAQQLLSQMA
jgi:pilus assembly protein FimV